MKHLTIAYLSIFMFAVLAGCSVLKSIDESPVAASMVLSQTVSRAINKCNDKQACANRYVSKASEIRSALLSGGGLTYQAAVDLLSGQLAGSSDMSIPDQLLLRDIKRLVLAKYAGSDGILDEQAIAGLNKALNEIEEVSRMYLQ